MKVNMRVTGVEAIGNGNVAIHAKSAELWNWITFSAPLGDLHKYLLGHTVEVEVDYPTDLGLTCCGNCTRQTENQPQADADNQEQHRTSCGGDCK